MKLENFCPQNESFSYLWQHHGVSRCFMETVSTSTLFSWIVVCWTIELYLYKRYATPVDENERPNTSCFRIQVATSIVLALLAVIRFLLQVTVIYSSVVYGYMLLVAVGGALMWPLSLWLILLERKYALPSIPAWGHSLGLLFFWTLSFVVENLSFLNLKNDLWWFRQKSLSDQIELGLFVTRYVCILLIFFLGLRAPGLSLSLDALTYRFPHRRLLEEGQINEQSASSVQLHRRSTFRNLWKKMRLLLPFLWPRKAPLLQTYVILCFLLLLAGRVINVFTPIYYKKIVDSLAGGSSKEVLVFRWDLILTYGSFMFLQGGGAGSMGFLNNARTFLWIRVQQFTARELGVQLFAHLHSLSLGWHLKRKTGEVLRSVDRGTSSISSLLSYILFNIMPTIADIIIAIIYFITAFNAWFGLIVFLTMALYLASTVVLTEWRTKYRRSMNQLDNAANARAVDSLLNFETVKYYAAEEFEVSKYRDAILEYQGAEWKTSASMSLLNTVQGTVITTGLLVSALYCAHLVVTHEQLTAGDYVLLSTYILQLYGPLNWFGTYYRMIQTAFVDMENMFDLLETDQDVKDVDSAMELKISEGGLEFNDVSFSYVIERPILKNVSFLIPPGKTVALVGPTGSGKTTIVRLLFRFYDIQSGQILIDGQNIRTVSQRSLRKFIGVVPQDTVLFNKTIRYNIHYGRVTATDEEVENAATSAEIHDQIVSFPDGYNTVVGERGLKLSGGEKQRVAIARTILKAPSIILLDEATSALDTRTERQIQTALSNVCANKTTLVVAHRLSTIVNADEILVLKDGEIVERGRHEDLLVSDGLYASMWIHQLKKQVKNGSNGQAEESSESVGYMSD